MLEMRPVVVGLGLFYHMRRDKQEIVDIIWRVSSTACHVEVNVTSDTLSALLMKQQHSTGTHVLFTIAGLEETTEFFEPLRLEFEGQIKQMCSMGNSPPGLHALTNHSEADFRTLGGLLPYFNQGYVLG
jgi:hypothetical protein